MTILPLLSITPKHCNYVDHLNKSKRTIISTFDITLTGKRIEIFAELLVQMCGPTATMQSFCVRSNHKQAAKYSSTQVSITANVLAHAWRSATQKNTRPTKT